MARYDVEGDVQFVQTQLDSAREYKKEQAKKQERFAKRLLAVDTLIARPLEATINKNAALADANQSFKKGYYEDLLTRAETIRQEDTRRLAAGVSRLQYLEETRFALLSAQSAETRPNVDLALAQRSFRQQAKEYAKNNIKEYTALVEKMSSVPSFEDLDKNYEAYSNIPRNGMDWIMKGVKNAVKGQTKETIEAEGKKSRDAFYGSPMLKKYEGIENAVKNYEALIGKGSDITDAMARAEKEQPFLGKIIPNSDKVVTHPTKYDPITGEAINDVGFYIARTNPKTNKIEYEEVFTATSKGLAKDNVISPSDMNTFIETVKPEHQDKAREILTKGGGTRQDYMSFIDWRSKNYGVLAVDWQDEKAIDAAFPGWYSSQIKYAEDEKGSSLSREIGNTGVYEIRANKQEDAVRLGIDEETMRAKFSLEGSKSSQSYTDPIEALNISKLLDDNYLPIEKLITDTDYLDTILGQTGVLTSAFNKTITSSPDQVVPLKTIDDAARFFPQSGLTGKYLIVFSKTDNQYYLKSQ
jgi:hypothetical protein